MCKWLTLWSLCSHLFRYNKGNILKAPKASNDSKCINQLSLPNIHKQEKIYACTCIWSLSAYYFVEFDLTLACVYVLDSRQIHCSAILQYTVDPVSVGKCQEIKTHLHLLPALKVRRHVWEENQLKISLQLIFCLEDRIKAGPRGRLCPSNETHVATC